MEKENIILFADRLREYVTVKKLKEVYIIYHGGEPLLLGKSILWEYTDIILNRLKDITNVEFSLQTNGTLLTDKLLEEVVKRKIKVSLSIDGPKEIHNKNRKMASGAGSFSHVFSGIQKLQKYPHLFQGIIGVINPHTEPEEIFAFFQKANLYDIDLLLPDANYERPPESRNLFPYIYINWLIKAFDAWFDKYQDLSFRTFESVLKCIMGDDSSSDFLGYGKLSYLTIETDGSYHTTDILKVAYEGASEMGISLKTSTIEDAVAHTRVNEYNSLLSLKNIPQICKSCVIKDICGGGSLPHRYSHENGFNNPTIYCNEMMALITHAKQRFIDEVDKELSSEKMTVNAK
jgi:radical SAM protein with 4Fe4S-binding SPASM domain